ncbi:MAG: YybH family protein [Chthoniobacterales bacterium]
MLRLPLTGRFLLVPFLVAFVRVAPCSDSPKPTAASDEQAVRELVVRFGDAFAKRDAPGVAKVFQEDGEFTKPGEMIARGRPAIEEYFRLLLERDGAESIPSYKKVELKLLETQVRFLRPEVAVVELPWSMTGAVRNGQTLPATRGFFYGVATKEGDGWGIATLQMVELAKPSPPH